MVILESKQTKLNPMFTKAELDFFKNPKGISQEWLDLFLRFEDHKRACGAIGIVGAGCYRYYKIS